MSNFSSLFFHPDLDFLFETTRKEKLSKDESTAILASLMDILACGAEENSYNILPSAATMLFHGLPGGDVHGMVEEMDRRGKSESVAISSVIDMGESETVRTRFCFPSATKTITTTTTVVVVLRRIIIVIIILIMVITTRIKTFNFAQKCIKTKPFFLDPAKPNLCK